MIFAKIFHSVATGQIVVINDYEDDQPILTFKFLPEGLGIADMNLKFNATDEGQALCDKAFTEMTEETATTAVLDVMEKMGLNI